MIGSTCIILRIDNVWNANGISVEMMLIYWMSVYRYNVAEWLLRRKPNAHRTTNKLRFISRRNVYDTAMYNNI